MTARRHRDQAQHVRPRGVRRHRTLLAAVALVLALAWLAWNVLLVESDVAGVADDQASQDAAATR